MAITFADVAATPGNVSTGGTLAMNTSANLKDLIVVFATTGGIGSSGPYTCGFTDSVNTGSYSNIAAARVYLAGNTQGNLLFIPCNATGTPTLTFTTNSGTGWVFVASRYTGFLNAATLITADVSTAQGTSSAFNTGSFNCTQNAELVIGIADNTSAITGGNVSSWNDRGGSGSFDTLYDRIGLASGTSVSLSGTGSASQWIGIVQGFYDAAGAPPPFTPFTQTQFFVTETIIQQ